MFLLQFFRQKPFNCGIASFTMGYKMATMSFNEYTQIALVIKQNFDLKQRIKKLETSLNDLWGEMSELRELLEKISEMEQ